MLYNGSDTLWAVGPATFGYGFPVGLIGWRGFRAPSEFAVGCVGGEGMAAAPWKNSNEKSRKKLGDSGSVRFGPGSVHGGSC